MKSIEEVLKQTEEDADKEILELKTKYEKDLKSERETLVKVRGELGIMKKKNVKVEFTPPTSPGFKVVKKLFWTDDIKACRQTHEYLEGGDS